jgi:thiosulfate dehydrogenase [quinone] large subunit
LRLFLGVTFLFAGVQKFSNPDFFNPRSPVSIQSQLAGSARVSPFGWLLRPLGHLATPLGLVIAATEVAVGLLTLTGYRVRQAATVGMMTSLAFFLTVSYHADPYYTGSDIVFAFAWIPLALAGGGRVLSLEHALGRIRSSAPADPARIGAHVRSAYPGVSRRDFVGGWLAGVGAGIAVFAGVLGRMLHRTSSTAEPTSLSLSKPGNGGGHTEVSSPASDATGVPAGSAQTQGGATTSVSEAVAEPTGTAIGQASSVAVGSWARFTDPASGDPAIVIHPRTGTFKAFDAVCPHAGCTVAFVPGQDQFQCPCHGSVFDGSTGAVLVGPAATGLRPIPISEGSSGELYVDG